MENKISKCKIIHTCSRSGTHIHTNRYPEFTDLPTALQWGCGLSATAAAQAAYATARFIGPRTMI